MNEVHCPYCDKIIYFHLFIGKNKFEEELEEYRILASNKDYFVINDYKFTTLSNAKDIVNTCINKPVTFKTNYPKNLALYNGYHVTIYSQMTEKITKRKAINALKKKIKEDNIFSDEILKQFTNYIKEREK